MKDLSEVAGRLQSFFYFNSIQAEYVNQPTVSARLVTGQKLELVIKFWERSTDTFLVDIQRYRGCEIEYYKLLRRLLEVALNKHAPEQINNEEVLTGIDLYSTLLNTVNDVEHCLMNGYLACKAMRLLISLSPPFKVRLLRDPDAFGLFNKAFQTGHVRHFKLKRECERLQGVLQR